MSKREKKEIRILVVDDEPGMRDLLSYELGSQGYQVFTAVDGLDAVAKVKTQALDLVISDIKMPKMDGISALDEIKKINPGLEVIMATGFGTIDTAVSAMKKGAYDFVQKPYNIEEIGALIEKALEKNELKTLIALYESSQAVFSTVNLKELLDLVMSLIQSGLKADEGSLMFLDESQKLYIACSKGLSDDLINQVQLQIGERIAGLAAQKRQEFLIINGLDKYPEFQGVSSNPRIGSSIVIPLISQNELLGVLTLNRIAGHENFNSVDLRSASIFASQVAQAVRNAKLFQALEQKIGELKSAYQMLDETKSQLALSEKLAAVGRLVAGIAHEINNPLTSVLGYIDLLLQSDVHGPVREDLTIVFREAQRCQKIVQDLVIFARRQKPVMELSQISELIDQILDSFSLELQKKAVEVKRNYTPCPAIYVDPLQMQQVFLNLIKNAGQALESVKSGRRIEISLLMANPSTMRMIFSDNGPGIPKENLDRVFEPFFTTKEVGRGTGLGLSLSYGIVQQHGGHLLIESENGKGTAFIIEIPAVTEKKEKNLAEEASAHPKVSLHGRKKILIVEDEAPIRNFLKRLLMAQDFDLDTAENGAIAFSKMNQTDFDLVLCDFLIPETNGMQLYDQVKKVKPKLAERFIFVSGCSADKLFDDFLRQNKLLRITKPFVPDQLLNLVIKKLSFHEKDSKT